MCRLLVWLYFPEERGAHRVGAPPGRGSDLLIPHQIAETATLGVGIPIGQEVFGGPPLALEPTGGHQDVCERVLIGLIELGASFAALAVEPLLSSAPQRL